MKKIFVPIWPDYTLKGRNYTQVEITQTAKKKKKKHACMHRFKVK